MGVFVVPVVVFADCIGLIQFQEFLYLLNQSVFLRLYFLNFLFLKRSFEIWLRFCVEAVGDVCHVLKAIEKMTEVIDVLHGFFGALEPKLL